MIQIFATRQPADMDPYAYLDEDSREAERRADFYLTPTEKKGESK
jgi:hypothetical protein